MSFRVGAMIPLSGLSFVLALQASTSAAATDAARIKNFEFSLAYQVIIVYFLLFKPRMRIIMSYVYKYPRPSVTTDILVFSIRQKKLQVLLIQRRIEPFVGQWAIPGGYLRMDEDLAQCAARELAEETGVADIPLQQFGSYGNLDRDPRGRVITIAFMALVRSDYMVVQGMSDARDARWFDIDDLPTLAFDHAQIIADGRTILARNMTPSIAETARVAFDFLPKEFTFRDAKDVFEILRGEKLDKGNFRKWILQTWNPKKTGNMIQTTGRRPATLYSID